MSLEDRLSDWKEYLRMVIVNFFVDFGAFDKESKTEEERNKWCDQWIDNHVTEITALMKEHNSCPALFEADSCQDKPDTNLSHKDND